MSIKILCVGGGNMARTIFKGVFNHAEMSSQIAQLCIINPSDISDHFNFIPAEKLIYHASLAEISSSQDFDLVILAIKPQVLPLIVEDWLSFMQKNLKSPLLLSVLAGVSTQKISAMLHLPPQHIIRAMPNMPLAVGFGSTALFYHSIENILDNATKGMMNWIEKIFQVSGQTLWLSQEEQMHDYTALCGSSPAYFFHILDAMIQKANHWGFDPNIRSHIIQAMKGAAIMAEKYPDLSLSELQLQVTSKGGTTAAALAAFANEPSLVKKINQGLEAAQERSKELASLVL